MSGSALNWLMDTCEDLRCSLTFADALDKQLASHAKMMTGIDLNNGYYGLVPPESPVAYEENNFGFVDTDLVAPDGMAYPVTIGWHCRKHPTERIAPSDDISPGCELEVVWLDFPINELSAYAQAAPEDDELMKHVAFEVDWQAHGWPNIVLLLQAGRAYKRDDITQIDAVIDETINSWNNRNSSEGIIHYRSEIRQIDTDRIEVHIDFGSALRDALTRLLRNIQTGVEFGLIKKVIISG